MSHEGPTLPNEACAHIIEEVAASERTDGYDNEGHWRPGNFASGASCALSSLCLVSRSWHQIAAPLLARYITLLADDIHTFGSDASLQRAILFSTVSLPRWRERVRGVSFGLFSENAALLDTAFSSLIHQLPHLTEVYVKQVDMIPLSATFPKTLAAMSRLQGLRSVSLESLQPPPETLPESLLRRSSSSLRTLWLDQCDIDADIWEYVLSLTHLTALTIRRCSIREAPRRSARLRELQCLEFSGMGLEQVLRAMDLELPSLSSLSLVDNFANRPIGDYVFPPHLRELKFLTSHPGSRVPFVSGQLADWFDLLIKCNPSIRELSLTEEAWTVAEMMTRLGDGELPNLCRLRLEEASPLTRDVEPNEMEVAVNRNFLTQYLHKRNASLVVVSNG